MPNSDMPFVISIWSPLPTELELQDEVRVTSLSLLHMWLEGLTCLDIN
jgi:hypothetical protein